MARIGLLLCGGLLATLSLTLALGCGGDTDPTGESKPTLRIGVILPMEGALATYGADCWEGIQLSRLNGFEYKGVRVELSLYNNNSDSNQMQNRVRQAINDGARLIIGAVASTSTSLGGVEAQNAEVAMLTPASTNDDLTRANPYITRICYNDTVQGEAAARLAINVLRDRNVASDNWKAVVVRQADNDYSIGLAASFARMFTENGGEVLTTEDYTDRDSEFHALVNNVRAQNPSVIFIPGYYPQVSVMLRQGAERWEGIPVVGADGWDSQSLFTNAGQYLDSLDCYAVSHFAADDPSVAEFVQMYEERFNRLPGSMSGLGYDTGLVVMDAVRRAIDALDAEGQVPSAEQLRQAVNTTIDVRGVTGQITVDPDTREVTKQPVPLRVTSTRFELYRSSR